MVEYKYDAWGNCKVLGANGVEITDTNHIGILNPFKYRSYYFDTETGLYFLKSRYYDSVIGRFISIDDHAYLDPDTVNGLNLYAYCLNNPIKYSDPTGTIAITTIILCVAALTGFALTIGGVATNNNTMTAIGLTMIAIPALISGVGAIVAGFKGATYLGAFGWITATSALGAGLFASAEYQEAFTGNNWMLDAGMSEEWYNGLMIVIATIATVGTISCGILGSIGKMGTQTLNSLDKHPKQWKLVKKVMEDAAGKKYKGGISTYSNYINKWTGRRIGTHDIIRKGVYIHGPHFHPWI